MALRSEMKDPVEGLRPEDPTHCFGIADVALHKVKTGVPLKVGEALQVARIGERIEPHDLPIGPRSEEVADQV
jgi:porphobilinogen deaminase